MLGEHPSIGGELVPASSVDLVAEICLREQAGEMDVSLHSVEWFWCPLIVPTSNFARHDANTTK